MGAKQAVSMVNYSALDANPTESEYHQGACELPSSLSTALNCIFCAPSLFPWRWYGQTDREGCCRAIAAEAGLTPGESPLSAAQGLQQD